MGAQIGRLMRVPLREVWRHEAIDFTTWLADNPDVLGEAIGISLASIEREHTVGSFSADLRAEDESGNIIVIENQLGRSDHDHLGKLVTYVSALDAKVAVWIVADPRPEHIGAISWLNEAGSTAFFLLKIEAVRIADSAAAPLLTRITGPSEEAIEVGKVKKDVAERHLERERFWQGLLERAKPKLRLFSNISPRQSGWIVARSGVAGLSFQFGVRQNDASVALYIDRGDQTLNKRIFERIANDRQAIEARFGEPLQWGLLPEKRACYISKQIGFGGYRSAPDTWTEVHEAMISAMGRLEEALRPHLAKIRESDTRPTIETAPSEAEA
jgi:hypothetical protein